MRNAYIAARHEKVIYVPRIQASVRHGIRINPVMHSSRLELVSGKCRRIGRVRKMQVYRPGGSERSVIIRNITVYVTLGKHMVANQAP